jgi:hypothetical protein
LVALGVDLNGVIRARKGDADISPRPEVEGAVRRLLRLHHKRFGDNMGVLSTAAPGKRDARMSWLDEAKIFARTGIPRANVTFCNTRQEKSKRAGEAGYTHFVDDHPEVLIAMAGIVPHRFLFDPPPGELERCSDEQMEGITLAWTWKELSELIKATAPKLAIAT